VSGADGDTPSSLALMGQLTDALDHIAPNIFNILCLPGVANYSDTEARTTITQALSYCADKRALFLVDLPAKIRKTEDAAKWSEPYRNADAYSGAIYYPRLVMPDPLQEFRPRNVAASGTLAGIYARTDTARGVWKAPAGIEAAIQGADLAVLLTDQDSGNLNPLGINALRAFPVYGSVVWGARTLAGADQIDSQWKYINVRRLADYIEESLFQGLKWVVFEPNTESTWSQIRLQINSFLAGLFAGGAFQGGTPDQAFFVHCDSTTTTQTDINRGIVNIIVGFAPSKPAEFVILQIEQIAGQTS
jgi:phage tail sheath protein FI